MSAQTPRQTSRGFLAVGMLGALAAWSIGALAADQAAASAGLTRYPVRPAAPAAKVESGKGLYSVNCSFCHGATAKGGETGPNLVRSETVLNDKDGELIRTIVQNGISDRGMPKFGLSDDQVSDIAAFIHSFPVGEGARSEDAKVNPLVGDAVAGKAFFEGGGRCSTCHTTDNDLKGVGARYSPRDLQGAILTGGRHGGPMSMASFFSAPTLIPQGTVVTVTRDKGQIVTGKLERIDEFEVVLTDDVSGKQMNIERYGNTPRVEIKNPMQAHLDLLRVLTDNEIHDLTAYLETLK